MARFIDACGSTAYRAAEHQRNTSAEVTRQSNGCGERPTYPGRPALLLAPLKSDDLFVLCEHLLQSSDTL